MNDSDIKNLMEKYGFEITPSVFYDMKNLLEEYKEKVLFAVEEEIDEEFKRGEKSAVSKMINFIEQRKWVWNEEKFGSVKNHKHFDGFVEELILELGKWQKE